MTAFWEVREGDALERLREMPDASVQCCVTSPPYFGLRDYGIDGQIGLESTPDEFVARLVDVFREVRRVLRSDGTLWLNIGDSYASSGTADASGNARLHEWNGDAAASRGGSLRRRLDGNRDVGKGRAPSGGCKPKDLLGIPWLLAFALRADGWWLRSEIIWAKRNCMPESVTDRPTKTHEQIFLLTKSARYFYDHDAIREPDMGNDHPRSALNGQPSLEPSGGLAPPHSGLRTVSGRDGLGANKRSVWWVATYPYAAAHFATFPPDLIEPCILAGSAQNACGVCGAPWERLAEREDQGFDGSRYGERAVAATGGARSGGTARSTLGSSNGKLTGKRHTLGWQPSCEHDDNTARSVVLDPFAGAGTTGVVALRHGRSFIGIEISPTYAEMARERIRGDAPLLNSPAEAAA